MAEAIVRRKGSRGCNCSTDKGGYHQTRVSELTHTTGRKEEKKHWRQTCVKSHQMLNGTRKTKDETRALTESFCQSDFISLLILLILLPFGSLPFIICFG